MISNVSLITLGTSDKRGAFRQGSIVLTSAEFVNIYDIDLRQGYNCYHTELTNGIWIRYGFETAYRCEQKNFNAIIIAVKNVKESKNKYKEIISEIKKSFSKENEIVLVPLSLKIDMGQDISLLKAAVMQRQASSEVTHIHNFDNISTKRYILGAFEEVNKDVNPDIDFVNTKNRINNASEKDLRNILRLLNVVSTSQKAKEQVVYHVNKLNKYRTGGIFSTSFLYQNIDKQRVEQQYLLEDVASARRLSFELGDYINTNDNR